MGFGGLLWVNVVVDCDAFHRYYFEHAQVHIFKMFIYIGKGCLWFDFQHQPTDVLLLDACDERLHRAEDTVSEKFSEFDAVSRSDIVEGAGSRSLR